MPIDIASIRADILVRSDVNTACPTTEYLGFAGHGLFLPRGALGRDAWAWHRRIARPGRPSHVEKTTARRRLGVEAPAPISGPWTTAVTALLVGGLPVRGVGTGVGGATRLGRCVWIPGRWSLQSSALCVVGWYGLTVVTRRALACGWHSASSVCQVVQRDGGQAILPEPLVRFRRPWCPRSRAQFLLAVKVGYLTRRLRPRRRLFPNSVSLYLLFPCLCFLIHSFLASASFVSRLFQTFASFPKPASPRPRPFSRSAPRPK